MPIPVRFSAPLLSLFRAVFGLMFLAHGVSKFFGLPPFPMPLNPLLTAAGVLELVGGTLLFVGLFTRPVAFLLSVKPDAWKKEVADIRSYLGEYGARAPKALFDELDEVEKRLN